MSESQTPDRFHCTPGGEVARGRKRLRSVLLGLLFLTLGVAAITAWIGRIGSAVVCALAAIMPLLAWRLLGDVDLLWLDIEEGELVVRLRGQLSRLPLTGASARRLDPDEIAHLRQLASHGSIVASTGSFESSRLGELDLYATKLENAVLVTGEERQIVVTPDDVDGFLTRLEEKLREADSASEPLVHSTAHE